MTTNLNQLQKQLKKAIKKTGIDKSEKQAIPGYYSSLHALHKEKDYYIFYGVGARSDYQTVVITINKHGQIVGYTDMRTHDCNTIADIYDWLLYWLYTFTKEYRRNR